jgi:uncharacterized repeat protein (TIGR03803 family)
MNCARLQEKRFRTTAAFLAAMVVLALTVAVIPASAQTYKVVYNFGSNTNDPITPGSGPNFIAQGRNGNLYSMSWQGGNDGRGAAFKVTLSGKLTVLANFVISNGDYPVGGLTLGSDGNLYGTTNQGGDPNCNLGLGCGTVLKITPAGKLTTLFVFPADNSNGSYPGAAPIQGSDGNFYGTTSVGLGGSTLYKMTPAGTMTLLHQFNTTDGNDVVAGLVEGSDGNFYGGSFSGGTNGDGVLFKVTPAGGFTVLHNFAGTDGTSAWCLIQATDGNFYGVTGGGGSSNAGVVFKITPGGAYTVLHNLNGTTDGISPYSSLVQATDGNFYGVANGGGSLGFGTIFKVTSRGVYSVVHNFDATTGQNPESALTQDTNGILYGDTYRGGSGPENCNGTCGVLYSLKIGAAPFARLVSDSGKVGSKIGILGQGFSSASVVKFNGVRATTVTRTGTTFLLATVPAGASNGKVTVTTGSITLTSSQTFTVHNSWSSGAVLPTALQGSATGVIGGKVYVVGGATNSAIVAINQIYNPKTNKWTTGASMPTARFASASAVVNGVLYVIGGNPNGSSQLNVVEAYDPTTNKWSTKSPMPTARDSIGAAVEGGIIYVAGGYNNTDGRLTTVESYNPATDKWAEEAPLLVGKSEPAVGLLGSTIVAAGGLTASGVTGDNEGYSSSKNSWSALKDDPTPRQSGCAATLSGHLYFAGGTNGTPLNVVESFNATSNKWTTLLPLPQAVVGPGSAEVNGLLYCFGGSNNGGVFQGSVYNYVQIYQP